MPETHHKDPDKGLNQKPSARLGSDSCLHNAPQKIHVYNSQTTETNVNVCIPCVVKWRLSPPLFSHSSDCSCTCFIFTLFQGSKSLLLHSVISQNNDTNTQSKTRDNPAIPKTKKRKHMSALEQERAEKERERAITAYRLMRKQRRQEKNETV